MAAECFGYEVGQVVYRLSCSLTDEQVVFLGRLGADVNSVVVGREGYVKLLRLSEISPLHPDETPTIDSRGYPIERKPELGPAGHVAQVGVKGRHPDAAPLLLPCPCDDREVDVAVANDLKRARRVTRTVTTVWENLP